MDNRTRARRYEVVMRPEKLEQYTDDCAAWHESVEEIEKGIMEGMEKARLLRWVRLQMGKLLTSRERHCVELYYFQGMSFREVGNRTSTNASSALRAVHRSIRKLREAARSSRIYRHKIRK